MGGSGSGKSTITKLLLKYYDPEDGEIDINGANLAEYTNSSVRRAIAYVPQNIELFSKTIYDNIRISRMDATLDEVKEAAKKADAHEFIRHLPLQYNTYLEEAGNGLSGGEKQRIALARAFLKDSNLYILDESTSNLDFATETLIFNMIYEQLADRSMLIVAHRLSTIRDCDLILVMDHARSWSAAPMRNCWQRMAVMPNCGICSRASSASASPSPLRRYLLLWWKRTTTASPSPTDRTASAAFARMQHKRFPAGKPKNASLWCARRQTLPGTFLFRFTLKI